MVVGLAVVVVMVVNTSTIYCYCYYCLLPDTEVEWGVCPPGTLYTPRLAAIGASLYGDVLDLIVISMNVCSIQRFFLNLNPKLVKSSAVKRAPANPFRKIVV